jgi:hypothetical protein
MIKSSEELHLLIIWEHARTEETKIIGDLGVFHTVVGVYDVSWSERFFDSNLSRFYGENLPKNSTKAKHCGIGPFVLVVFIDKNPEYKLADSSRGSEYVNNNVFSLKQKYRKWTGGGHKVHATNSPKETRHDLKLLLGIDYDSYLRGIGTMTPKLNDRGVVGDLYGGGEQGWPSLKEMLVEIITH